MRERTHPVVIYANIWRVFYLLVIPVLRGFFSALRQDFFAWLSGAWIDVTILIFMITVAVLQWYYLTYSCDSGVIRVASGLLFRRETLIPCGNICTLTVIEPFYLRPVKACCLRADTPGGSRRNADLNIFLKRRKADALILAINGGESRHAGIKNSYIPQSRSILALSLFSSNSFAGIVFLATFISQSGRLLGNEFSGMLLLTFEDLARRLAFGIPPAAAAIAYAMLAGWLIGFASNYVNYRNFSVECGGGSLRLKGGLSTKREYWIREGRLNYVDVRTGVLSMLFGVRSLYISAVGCGKHKHDITCAVPAEKGSAFTAVRQRLFPGFEAAEPVLSAPEGTVMRFIGPALLLCAFFPGAAAVLIRFFPLWSSFLMFTSLMLLAPSAAFLAIRFIAFRMGGAAKSGNCYTLCYASGFSLHTVIIPESKAVTIELRQSFFQAARRPATCDLAVFAFSESRSPHICKNLVYKDALALIKNNRESE